MCQLLVMAINKTHIDPFKDATGCYKRGDIVEVFEDGRLQTPQLGSPFVLINVTGVTKAQADKYMEPRWDSDNVGTRHAIQRRAYQIDYTILPTAFINKLRDTREATVSLTQVKNYIRNKQTGVLG